jgi:uncharacterized DUF497 family protein
MMIDVARIVGFDWDEGNARKSKDKHGVTQREAEEVFLDRRMLVMVDEKHSLHEPRYHAYGSTKAGRRLQVAFTLRENETLIRVISARDMSRRERTRYDEEQA